MEEPRRMGVSQYLCVYSAEEIEQVFRFLEIRVSWRFVMRQFHAHTQRPTIVCKPSALVFDGMGRKAGSPCNGAAAGPYTPHVPAR